MIADFVAQYARLNATYPQDVAVESIDGNEVVEIILHANKLDVGKLIGKDGKMIGAIKTLISGCKAKDGKSYRINVEPIS